MDIVHIVGARPNLMKAAPVIRALARYESARQTLVHSGQHYDSNMSEVFFRELGLPESDANLGVGSGSHAQQTAEIMIRFEPVVVAHKPDLVLVYGDVNSTVAAALVCAKLLVPVGHVEAGLRSLDRTMPEEINRLLTDQIGELLFTPSPDADENLLREGVAREKIHLVGNVMIDTLVQLLPKALEHYETQRSIFSVQQRYGVVTLHRPSNVDDLAMLGKLMSALSDIGRDLPLIFPVHPRTRHKLETLPFVLSDSQLHLVDPLGYLDFLGLQSQASFVITDSGGVQEETTYLNVPCLTLRENTERPITVTQGTNTLIGQDMEKLRAEVGRILNGDRKQGQLPALWDGRAAERIGKVVANWGCLT